MAVLGGYTRFGLVLLASNLILLGLSSCGSSDGNTGSSSPSTILQGNGTINRYTPAL